jgi:exodeoxyribonuclease VII large subunit
MALRRQRLAITIPRPHQQIAHAKKQLKSEVRALKAAAVAFVRERRRALDHFAALLESFSYQRVLERGFALVADGAGNPIESVAKLAPGMGVRLRLSDGEAGASITDVAGGGGKKAKPKKPKPGGDGRQGTLL